ncbi:hypothetical protein Tco_0970062 [Tanacetum coccineum]
MEDTLSKFMGESAKRHEENSNLIKEIRASMDDAIRNQGASIKTLSLDPFLEDYIELNDKEGEVIEEYRTRDEDLNTGIDDYPSYCGDDKKIYIDWDNVVGALMNVPIFVGTFSVVTDFAVLEDMDAYRDKGMGDVIVGKPFLREVGIKARRFDGMITIYNGNDEVTYQMVRSHPRFKNHTNEQYNKIPPLLKDLGSKRISTNIG